VYELEAMDISREDGAGPGFLPGQAGAVLVDRTHGDEEIVDVDLHLAAIGVACVG